MLKRPPARGFTLIELLAVIAILLVLVSLLLPMLGNLRGMAMIVRCKAVVKSFGTGAILYANDADGRLPAVSTAGGYYGPPPYTNVWLGSEVGIAVPGLRGDSDFLWPGIIQEYIRAPVELGRSYYRCPLLSQWPLGTANDLTGPYGSNGAFDYTMFSYANGGILSQLPRYAKVNLPDANGSITGVEREMPAPIFTEEDPRYGNNFNFIDADHTTINRDGVWHYRGACMYFCVDGSVQDIAYNTPIGPEAQAWTAMTPSGIRKNIGKMGTWDAWRKNL